ncbi:MAG TPA: NADPH-dependent glutamate synthase [Candidatus Ventrousia excrementavium]|uniref:NADPH-dependent glutamate synthase n=1 Tax=Candidatus Ventrousia excrementavium TaxID=2840961 RepID=A0A9D1LL18_9CLOT|nr:NADPH-dependent glutamate synthase [Candidatus Ventrousia excrementavium]
MANMSLTKVKISEQDPAVRNHNFLEVSLGYTAEEAMEEASRCLGCKNEPCRGGCPVAVSIPQFIAQVKEGNFAEAYRILSGDNALPAVCGRVCPQETQCESKCVRGIKGEPVAIGRLERFVADWARENGITNEVKIEKNGDKVAVVGSGPAGLTCAGELAKMGYDVTIFEALHTAGGVLSYGIPEFRLPKEIVRKEIEGLQKMGVDVETNMVIGKVLSIDELFERGYKAVFVGSGAGLPQFMKIPGEGLCGVYSANEYLTRINLMKAYTEGAPTPLLHSKSVAVVGGGNVAMDAARCAKRMGADKVYIVYRRGEEELPARKEEVHHAKEEGIIFELLTAPLSIEGDEKGRVNKMKCIRMELGEPDASGRRRPVPVEGSEFDMEVDTVIMAIGTSPNPLIRSTTPGLEANKKGCLVTKEDASTTREGIFCGGDAATGAATVILAMGAGKHAAKSIDEYIKSKK